MEAVSATLSLAMLEGARPLKQVPSEVPGQGRQELFDPHRASPFSLAWGPASGLLCLLGSS